MIEESKLYSKEGKIPTTKFKSTADGNNLTYDYNYLEFKVAGIGLGQNITEATAVQKDFITARDKFVTDNKLYEVLPEANAS